MHKACNKERKLRIPAAHGKWVKWLFPLFGLFGLVWFLARVIPKPSRATYPCMRVAAPLASSFVVWLLGLGGAAIAVRTACRHIRQIRYVRAALWVLAAAAAFWLGLIYTEGPPASASLDAVNDPIGTARGYKPGRVAWVHDPESTDWEGPEPGNGSCWEPDHIDQAVVDSMMSRALRWLTAKPTDAQAWDALFRYFNMQRWGEDEGYRETEKIAIKINLTLCHVSGSSNPSSRMLNRHLEKAGNTNPQMVMALLRQLVNRAKVPQENISVGDTVTFFPKQWYDYLWEEFPNVHYLDHYPYEDPMTGYVATPVQFSTTDFHWSTPDANQKVQDYLPLSFAEADYIINFAVLKSHERAGITASAKNHFGSLFRSPPGRLQGTTYNYYNVHDALPCGGGTVTGNYWPLVDLMGHAELGGKTVLHLIDGLFGGQIWYGLPYKWNLAPFNNDWPSSLFASQDAVAIDSVAYDFLVAEWSDDIESSACGAAGAQDYLHEAALAHDPLSETFYEPENDGTTMASLGVHEHWDNASDKQYTRNLGIGDGIELIGSDPGVDTPPGDFNEDGDVDGGDIAAFVEFYFDEDPDPHADLNNDNVVDDADVGKFAEYFGETGYS